MRGFDRPPCVKCIGQCECGGDRGTAKSPRNTASQGSLSRAMSSPGIVRTTTRSQITPLSFSPLTTSLPEKTSPRPSASFVVAKSAASSPLQPPSSPRGRLATVASAAASLAKAPDVLFPTSASLSPPVFVAICQQLSACAQRQGPDAPVGRAVERIMAAAKNWTSFVPLCSYQDSIDLLVHALRTLEAPLVTSELCRWVLEVEMGGDDEHRFQLFYSLVNCLPSSNRSMLMHLKDGLAGFPSVMALQLGPALLGLPASMPSGQVFVKFLVAFPGWAVQAEPVEPGSWVVGSCALGKILGLVVDQYYCAMLEPDFSFLVADMHGYVWPSPEAAVLNMGEVLRRFMRPGAWALEARSRLVSFLLEFVRRLGRSDPPLRNSERWRKNWTWLTQLLSHPLNIGGEDAPQTMKDGVRFLVNFLLPPDESVPSLPIASQVPPGFMEQPLEEMNPKAAASAIRRMFLKPFAALSLSHLIKQRWMTPALSPPFAHLVMLFNGLQSWAVSWILEHVRPKDRATNLMWILKCAHHCKKQNNFHAAMALFLAAGDPAISRLTRTWKEVSSKGQTYLSELKALADPKNNHQCYAAALKAASQSPPVIPYMALVSKYLFSMGDANPDTIESTGFINIAKFRMIRNYIQSVLALKDKAEEVLAQPLAVVDAPLQAFFVHVSSASYDNQALYELSLEREPRAETMRGGSERPLADRNDRLSSAGGDGDSS